MMKRRIYLALTVECPATVGEAEVEQAINSALDEGNGQNDWGEWVVGAATIEKVEKFKDDEPSSFSRVVRTITETQREKDKQRITKKFADDSELTITSLDVGARFYAVQVKQVNGLEFDYRADFRLRKGWLYLMPQRKRED